MNHLCQGRRVSAVGRSPTSTVLGHSGGGVDEDLVAEALASLAGQLQLGGGPYELRNQSTLPGVSRRDSPPGCHVLY